MIGNAMRHAAMTNTITHDFVAIANAKAMTKQIPTTAANAMEP